MADHDDDSVKLALLAHDLRTPLAAMRLTAELIGQRPLDDSQSEQLSILIKSIDALTELTGDLVSAAEPGATAQVPPVRVCDVVRECTELFQVAAAAKTLTCSLTVEDNAADALTLQGGALRRVVTTLLDNAVKYTSAGSVDVRVAPDEGPDNEPAANGALSWICVSIADSGPGIDPEESARLFRPFVRGRHGRETGPGTGLGLWGTAQLVHEMGGRLDLKASDSGGSLFEVLVPVTHNGEPASPDRGETPAQRAGAPGQLRSHVLIVDDNDTNCRLLSALLESFGATCEIAKSGPEAIALVEKNAYDAVLLDLHMPGMSGVETADVLRGSKGKPPLIAVTAALESIRRDDLKAAGFEDILAKPLSPSGLYEILQNVGTSSGGADTQT